MEEDIKILEEVIEKYKTNTANILDLDSNDLFKRLILNQEQVQLLENLIKGYRELEGKIEKQKHSFIDGYFEGGNNQHNIWVSKIKEIRDKAEVMDYYTLNNVIDDLTKLLGDE